MEKIGELIKKSSEDEIGNYLKEANSVLVVGYSGLSGPDMNNLRTSLHTHKSKLFVVKNSISKRVLNSHGLEEFSKMLQGPCGLIFVKDDIIAASKIIYNFAKEHETFKIEGGILKNRVLNKADITTLASIPGKEVLYTKIAVGMKAPVFGLVNVLNATLKKLVIVLEQIKNK